MVAWGKGAGRPLCDPADLDSGDPPAVCLFVIGLLADNNLEKCLLPLAWLLRSATFPPEPDAPPETDRVHGERR